MVAYQTNGEPLNRHQGRRTTDQGYYRDNVAGAGYTTTSTARIMIR